MLGTLIDTVGGIQVFKADGRVFFRAGMTLDCDGSPRAYSPGNLGEDYTANAGRPGDWWGIVTDDDGNPVIQGPQDPAPGYYVSTTSLQNPFYDEHDPRRYVDSDTIPFIVLPGRHFQRWGIKLGADCIVTYNGRTSTAIFADIGPGNHLGEGSIALANALSINPDPKHGGVESGVTYSVACQ